MSFDLISFIIGMGVGAPIGLIVMAIFAVGGDWS